MYLDSSVLLILENILENINTTVRQKTGLNQWKNSSSVINWYSNIQHKNQHTFAVFDIENFYPSITEKLFTNARSTLPNNLLIYRVVTLTSSCIQGNHSYPITARPGSKKTTVHSTSPWAVTTVQTEFASQLVYSFSAVYLTSTGKKYRSVQTTDLPYSETPQDHKPKESQRPSLDTSRTTDLTSPYRRT